MLTLVKDADVPVQPAAPPPERRPRSTLRESNYNRRRFLAWLHDEVAVLRALGMDHRRIAAQLDIAEHDVRAFCPKPKEKILRRHLPRRAVEALLHGRHASIGGRTVAKRSRYLVEIASAYTWNELMSESGVGTVTASEIRLWLEERGAALRGDEDDQHRSAQW